MRVIENFIFNAILDEYKVEARAVMGNVFNTYRKDTYLNLYINNSSKNLLKKGKIEKVNKLYSILILTIFINVLLVRINILIMLFLLLFQIILFLLLIIVVSPKFYLGYIIMRINNVNYTKFTCSIIPVYIYSYKGVIHVSKEKPPRHSRDKRRYVVSPFGIYYAFYDYIVSDKLSIDKLSRTIRRDIRGEI